MELLPDPVSNSVDQAIIHLSASLLSPRSPRQPFNFLPSAFAVVPENEFITTFALVIEPLIFGVLPKTALPALGWILVFGLGAAWVVPIIIRYLDTIGAKGGGVEEERKSR
jgi:hypothetical protein